MHGRGQAGRALRLQLCMCVVTHSGHASRALIKWRLGYYRYSIVDYVDKDFETYTQGRGKLSCHCTSRSKMELIHMKSRMKGQGSREVVEELTKERLTIDVFEESGVRVLDCVYK